MLPSERMYVSLYMCVFKVFYETTGPIRPKFMWNHNRIGKKIKFKWFRPFVILHYFQSPQGRAFSGALKIEKLKAPLFPGPRGPWIQMTGALIEQK